MSLNVKVIDVVAKVIKVKPECLDCNSGLGTVHKWDSLNHTNLILELEDVFEINFDFDELDKIITIEAIVKSLKEKGIKE